jgi:RecG-like helicase
LAQPATELDEERLRAFCAAHTEAVPIGEVRPRDEVTVVGEVTSVRVVPKREGSWLEATVTDGRDKMVAMWTGRRRLPGVTPGRRIVMTGRASEGPGGRYVLLNPLYELL